MAHIIAECMLHIPALCKLHIRDEPSKEHVRPLGSGKSYYSQPEKPIHRMLNRFHRVHQNLEGNRRQYSQNFKLRMLKNTQRKGSTIQHVTCCMYRSY